ncbi:MAG TPA: hypothetical protein VH309_05925 [Elusimicrobiota bacterium]|jgi:hypothetical protein|nr:hypothetical protein [Elusimicrobiota bacterium]
MRVLWACALLFCAASARAGAFDAFLLGVSSEGLPTAAMRAGADALRGVEFKDEAEMGPATAMFLPDVNEIYLGRTTRDPETDGVKSSSELGPVDCSVVIHELWHSYYLNRFRGAGGDAAKLFLRGWRVRYGAYPADEREGIQDEAYALYIQEAARAFLQVHRILKGASPERRKALMGDPRFAASYERGFADHVYGYYRGPDGMPITVSVPLTDEDEASIRSFFFSGRVSGKFDRDFAEFAR